MIKIDKNIPIPNVKKKESIYPLLKMEVGDSFFIKCDLKQAYTRRTTISNYVKINNLENNTDWKFKTRITDNGLRVWRIQ